MYFMFFLQYKIIKVCCRMLLGKFHYVKQSSSPVYLQTYEFILLFGKCNLHILIDFNFRLVTDSPQNWEGSVKIFLLLLAVHTQKASLITHISHNRGTYTKTSELTLQYH